MSVTIRPIEELKARLQQATGQRWRWYHGAAFYLTAQAFTFGLSGLVNIVNDNKGSDWSETLFGDVSYFRGLKQAKITPPSWVFGPAWTINNISMIWGTLRVLNMPKNKAGRQAYLGLQAATWVNYIAFNAAYFSLRSPINAFVLTLSFFLLTIASGLVAIFRLKDSRVALSLATLFIWLIIALTAATAQMLWNKDELYQVGPFAKPNPAFAKEGSAK